MYKVCNSPGSKWPDSASCCVLAAGVTGPCSTEYRSFKFASRQPADATAVLNPSGSATEVGCIKLDVQQVVSWGLQQQTLMLGTAGPCGGQGTCPKAEDKKVGSMRCTDEPASVCRQQVAGRSAKGLQQCCSHLMVWVLRACIQDVQLKNYVIPHTSLTARWG